MCVWGGDGGCWDWLGLVGILFLSLFFMTSAVTTVSVSPHTSTVGCGCGEGMGALWSGEESVVSPYGGRESIPPPAYVPGPEIGRDDGLPGYEEDPARVVNDFVLSRVGGEVKSIRRGIATSPEWSEVPLPVLQGVERAVFYPPCLLTSLDGLDVFANLQTLILNGNAITTDRTSHTVPHHTLAYISRTFVWRLGD